MMNALNDMLDADARGEHTPEQFAEFMQQYGDFFPDNPANLEELIDSLAQRAAAMQRLMNSLTPEQRAELDSLMEQAMGDAGLAEQMARLQAGLRSARPDLPWGGRERMNGDQPMGFADATGALSELADLDRIAELATQNYPGASLADIDDEMIERALGRPAVEDLEQLRRIERELQKQGYLERGSNGLQLTPQAIRRLGVDGAAAGLRAARIARPRRARRARRRRGRRGHRRQPRMALRRRAAARRGEDRAQRRDALGRRARAEPGAGALRRAGLRGRRDRAALVRGDRAARRHVLLDGAARHLGRGQDDGDGAALAGDDEVPARQDRDHRLQRLRPRADARAA